MVPTHPAVTGEPVSAKTSNGNANRRGVDPEIQGASEAVVRL